MEKIDKLMSLLKSKEDEAYIRRVNWIFFEERIEEYFSSLNNAYNFDALGGLYLINNRKSNPIYNIKYLYKSNFINHIQISTGWRRLNVYKGIVKDGVEKVEHVLESESALVFSQGINGKIMVFLYPYKSSIASVNEENIILHLNIEPHELTEKKISSILNTYIKYCVATSAISFDSQYLYFWRLWLIFRDFRNKQLIRNKSLYFIEKIIILFVPVLAVWATLFTSSKWPNIW
ncbi:hypothetical protein [Cellvibrio sp. PSBB023]|uniref:hypothetical protein n=1 Tax=Cellvibrio sp. PSBB023 TaxID=1945512 RepID=UPI0009900EF8|nr:hypothetical protein [Cellvibrio sp. PSBB023]AQT61497.1 hypothetical protein B0D95_16320 [Cellvibrio sp. PSBB023]